MPPTTKLKSKPVTLEQQQNGCGYVLKWLSQDQFWQLGRERYFVTLSEVNKQAAAIKARANALKARKEKVQNDLANVKMHTPKK